MNPSPRAHVYRLLILLVIGIAGFAVVKKLAVPESWDYERWYRLGAEEDLKQQPLRFGGNESCAGSICHVDSRPQTHQVRFDALGRGNHKGLSCEACHGPLGDHVQDGKPVGRMPMNSNSDLCMSCHQKLVTRPQQFAQFSEDLLYHALLGVTEISACRSCHDPHDPN